MNKNELQKQNEILQENGRPSFLETLQKNTALIIFMASILFGVYNIYVVAQLAPIAKDIAVLTTRVSAIEKDYSTKSDIDGLGKRLDNLQQTQSDVYKLLVETRTSTPK